MTGISTICPCAILIFDCRNSTLTLGVTLAFESQHSDSFLGDWIPSEVLVTCVVETPHQKGGDELVNQLNKFWQSKKK